MLKIDDPMHLTESHPVLALVQNCSDLVDPINYARLINMPGNKKHLLQVQGGLDPYTPRRTAENLAIALRLPALFYPNVTTGYVHEGAPIANLQPVGLPIGSLIDAGDGELATGAYALFPTADHFPVFHQNLPKILYKSLFSSMASGNAPVIE